MADPITGTAVPESPIETSVETPKELTSADLEKQIELLKAEKEKSEKATEVVEKKIEIPVVNTEVKPEVKIEQAVQPIVQPPVTIENFQYKQPVVNTEIKAVPRTEQGVQPSNPVEEFKNWAKENYQVDPVETTMAILKVLNRPNDVVLRRNQLLQETMKLSTSEETKEAFANKAVREEMEKVIQSDPNRWMDELGWVKPEYMRDVFYIAKGRTNTAPQIKNVVEQPVPVEGRNKVTTPQTPDFGKMTSAEVEAYIRTIKK
jgi:hypothetical protein